VAVESWFVLWTWAGHHGRTHVSSYEDAWTEAHDRLAKGYQVAFSLALTESMKLAGRV